MPDIQNIQYAQLCDRCGKRELRPVLDDATGQAVVEDGKRLVRCSACNDVQIVGQSAWLARVSTDDRDSIRMPQRWFWLRLGWYFYVILITVGSISKLHKPWNLSVMMLALSLPYMLAGISAIVLQTTDHWTTAILSIRLRIANVELHGQGRAAITSGIAAILVASVGIAIGLLPFAV